MKNFKKMRKIASMGLAITMMLGAVHIPASAASNRRCYTIKNENTQVYSNTGLTKKYGAIYGSDEVTVLDVHSAYSKVKYPVSKGTKTGYIRTSAILLGTGGTTYTSRGKITTYKRPGGGEYGYVAKGDDTMVLGKTGDYTQVKYPVSGGYKYAFITNSDANRNLYSNGGTGSSNNSAQKDALFKTAHSQLGIQERKAGSDDIKYNDWYYGRRVKNSYSGQYAWCAVFVSWCANQSGISKSVIPHSAGTRAMKNGIISNGGKKHLRGSGYKPVHGDIIFFGNDAGDHIGIVDYSSGNTVYYIDGNNTSMNPHGVHYSSRSLSDSWYWGCVTPKYTK